MATFAARRYESLIREMEEMIRIMERYELDLGVCRAIDSYWYMQKVTVLRLLLEKKTERDTGPVAGWLRKEAKNVIRRLREDKALVSKFG